MVCRSGSAVRRKLSEKERGHPAADRIQAYFTLTRASPRAGAVTEGTTLRSRAASIPGMDSGLIFPCPQAARRPAILRTICLRKPSADDAEPQERRVRRVKLAGGQARQRSREHRAACAFHVRARILQTCKILFSQQMRQSRVHGCHVQRTAIPDEWGQLRRHKEFFLPELVGIGFALGILAGVKVRSRRRRREHPDFRRQQGIETAPPIQSGLDIGHVAMGHLSVGMHARVRAARTMHPHGRALPAGAGRLPARPGW